MYLYIAATTQDPAGWDPHHGTLVLVVISPQNFWWMLKLMSTELSMRYHETDTHQPLFYSERWASSGEQAPGAETFFSHQNLMSTGFDEFWSQKVLRYECILFQSIDVNILDPLHQLPCSLLCTYLLNIWSFMNWDRKMIFSYDQCFFFLFFNDLLYIFIYELY